VAVGLVLLYHAGIPFVPAGFVGVDVFFVISGFLITGLLVSELQRSGTISLAGFYARRAKRLLPAAAIVLATTTVGTLLFLPQTRWSAVGGDIVSSALYFVNWRLADRSVDYLAEDAAASPVQHFWSLAVEEQYYLVWPLLLLVVAWLARRRRGGSTPNRSLWIGLAAVGLPSLAWSVYYTQHEQASAFFVTTTRMWELAVGAGVALAAARLASMPRPLALVLGWGGLAAIAVSALVYSTSSAWPGYAALLPVLGAGAVIAAGGAAGPAGPVALLGTGLFRWFGGLSYSLYLWHWPMIVFAAAYLGELRVWQGSVVAACSLLPAWLTFKLVENPVRYSRRISRSPRLALAIGACLTVVGVAGGLAPVAATELRTAGTGEVEARGAGVFDSASPDERPTPPAGSLRPKGILPDPLKATEDVPDAYERGCQVQQTSSEPTSCDYGDPDGEVTIAVIGDSKVLQWISAIDQLGEERGWRVKTYTKSTCTFADATISTGGEPYTACTDWNNRVVKELLADPPDVVLTSQGRSFALDDPDDAGKGSSADAMREGLQRRWAELGEAGIRVAVLLDNPHPSGGTPVYECVADHRSDPSPCGFDRATAERRGAGDIQREAASGAEDVDVVDLTDYICPGDTCEPVIGNVLVYRQGSHITKTYVDTLAPFLGKQLEPIVERARS
jgi:peptidoglycan/LPS O-acetylase OafA/YrhL